MAVLKLFSDNPNDGTTSFDKVRFYEADDANGTNAAVIATVAIDTTTTSPIHPGFTSFVYSAASTSKFYASTWYNSISVAESNKSPYVQGGQDRLDTRFNDEMQDTTSTVFSSTDRANFKQDAIETLYPDFFRNVIDTSLTVTNTSADQAYVYTVPFGIFNISEVGFGVLDNSSSTPRTFKVVKPAYWKYEKNQLRFEALPNWANGDSIRLVCQKKYQEVGELPSYLDTLLLYHMRMSAFLKLADDYPRFLKWGQLQSGTKVSFENLRVHAREFERKFNDLRKQLKDNSLASLQ